MQCLERVRAHAVTRAGLVGALMTDFQSEDSPGVLRLP